MEEPVYIVPTFGDAYTGPALKGQSIDMRDRAMALCKTAKHLGINIPAEDEDREAAHTLAKAYAIDPVGASEKFDEKRAGTVTPAALIEAGSILDEFGQLVVKDALRVRNLVTNKLLLESDGPDWRQRQGALKMLGNMSDVGLFTEKREITHKNESAEELRDEIRRRLKDMGVVTHGKQKNKPVLIEHDE